MKRIELAALMKIASRSMWVLAALVCTVPAARAQIMASLQGQVTDSSGAPVTQASLTAKNPETGAERLASTDDTGRYRIVWLPVGSYEVRAREPGFQEEVRSGIQLAIGQEASVDLRLQVSTLKSEVRVFDDARMVSTTTRDISGLVGEQQMKELPLNGRSFDLLLPLNPGVVNFTWMKTGGTGI